MLGDPAQMNCASTVANQVISQRYGNAQALSRHNNKFYLRQTRCYCEITVLALVLVFASIPFSW